MPDLMELMTRVEELDAELKPYVTGVGNMPMVKHPLVYELLFDTSRCALINYRFKLKQEQVDEAIRKGNPHSYVFLHERPYRFDALRSVMRDWADGFTQDLVESVWVDSENIWQNQAGWRQIWQSLDSPWLHQDVHNRKFYASLPEEVTLYRGIAEGRNPNGLSWTTDRERAAWFAGRFKDGRRPPVLITGKASKRSIIAVFVDRNESEVVINGETVRYKRREVL